MADPLAEYQNAISGIESGGRYDAVGPVTKNGDRAYGLNQVMGANIGPWTEKYYGERLTPEQFLASPEAQNAVFRGEFGRLAAKYGPEGAARAWFAGEKGMNNPNAKDVLGTTVQGYGQKFMAGLGQPQSIRQAAPPMGLQPAPPQSGGLLPQQPAQAPSSAGLLNFQQPQQQAAPQEQPVDPFAQGEKDHFAAMKAMPALEMPNLQKLKQARLRMAQR